MKVTHIATGALVAIIIVAPVLLGQDVCIPHPITVTLVQGNVYFELGGKRQPLSDVAVEVSPYGYKKPPIATASTKDDGKFSMPQVRAGRYYLSVRHGVVIGLSVEMRVKRRKQKKDSSGVIQIVLKNDPSKYCAGGTVAVVRESEGLQKETDHAIRRDPPENQ